MAGRRHLFQILTYWVLAGALLGHLAAPAIYLAGIACIRANLPARLAANQQECLLFQIPTDSVPSLYSEADNELVIDGRRYDVIHVDRSLHMTLFRALPDERETCLQNGLNHLAGSHESSLPKIRFWFAGYFQEKTALQLPPAVGCFHAAWIAYPDTCFSMWKEDRPSPPPWRPGFA